MGNQMNASELAAVLTSARVFTDRDTTLPMLCAVKIEATENQLLAMGTDRFTLGIARAETYTGEAFDMLIDGANVDKLVRMAKTSAKQDRDHQNVHGTPRTVVINLTGTGAEFTFSTGESIVVSAADYQFPKVRQLLPQEIDADKTSPITIVNPDYMAKFAKVAAAMADRAYQMRVYNTGATRPSVVLIGANFIGLIMPVRHPDPAYSRPAWLDPAVAPAADDTADASVA